MLGIIEHELAAVFIVKCHEDSIFVSGSVLKKKKKPRAMCMIEGMCECTTCALLGSETGKNSAICVK